MVVDRERWSLFTHFIRWWSRQHKCATFMNSLLRKFNVIWFDVHSKTYVISFNGRRADVLFGKKLVNSGDTPIVEAGHTQSNEQESTQITEPAEDDDASDLPDALDLGGPDAVMSRELMMMMINRMTKTTQRKMRWPSPKKPPSLRLSEQHSEKS